MNVLLKPETFKFPRWQHNLRYSLSLFTGGTTFQKRYIITKTMLYLYIDKCKIMIL